MDTKFVQEITFKQIRDITLRINGQPFRAYIWR